MPEEAFGEWYALRWGIEVHDGQEQYALEMENFSSCAIHYVSEIKYW